MKYRHKDTTLLNTSKLSKLQKMNVQWPELDENTLNNENVITKEHQKSRVKWISYIGMRYSINPIKKLILIT